MAIHSKMFERNIFKDGPNGESDYGWNLSRTSDEDLWIRLNGSVFAIADLDVLFEDIKMLVADDK